MVEPLRTWPLFPFVELTTRGSVADQSNASNHYVLVPLLTLGKAIHVLYTYQSPRMNLSYAGAFAEAGLTDSLPHVYRSSSVWLGY